MPVSPERPDERRPEPTLTPYVSRLRDHVEEALRFLLGMPHSVPLAWVEQLREGTWRVHVMIGADGELDLDLSDDTKFGWFDGQHFSAGYRRRRDGTDPSQDPADAALLGQLKRRLDGLDRRRNGEAWNAFRDALATAAKFDGIKDSMFRSVGPSEAIVRLGFRCNQKCDFCWQDRAWPAPPESLYETWVREVAATGCTRVTFTGGEPTLHRGLPDLVRLARSLGMHVSLQSNCIQMAKPGFAQTLADAGVDFIFASFHSHDAQVSDEMTRAPRTHTRTVLGLEACIDAGIAVELNAVVERRNYPTLASYAAFIETHFAVRAAEGQLSVHLSHPCAGLDGEPWEHNIVSLAEIRPHLVGALQRFEKAGVATMAVGTCGFPPCVVKDVPSVLRRMDRGEQLDGDVEGRVFLEPCGRCAFRSACLGVRTEYAERFGAAGIEPFDDMPDVAASSSPAHRSI